MHRSRAPLWPWLLLAFLPLPALAEGGIRAFFYDTGLLETLKRVGIAVGVLFIGWLVARSLEKVIYTLLRKTDLDNRLFAVMGMEALFRNKTGATDRVERIAGRIVFYTIMLLAIAGALDAAGLGDTAGPLRAFVQTIVEALPFVGKAILIVVVFWVVGMLLRKLVTRALSGFDGRLGTPPADVEAGDVASASARAKFSVTAGTVVFWLAMLVGLAGAFESLQIDVVANPLKNMLTRIIEAVPALVVAALIVLGGYVLGRLARAVVTNLLASAGIDALPRKIKLEQMFARRKLSDVLGLGVMVFVMLHATIAALDRLGLDAVSRPLSRTIDQFWQLLPSLMVAAVILLIGVLLGRIARGIVTGVLEGIGFDALLRRVGIDFERLRPVTPAAVVPPPLPGMVGLPPPTPAEVAKRFVDTPSEFAGLLAQITLVMLAVVEVFNTLNLEAWAAITMGLLYFLLVRVVGAAVILCIGFGLGNYVRALIINRGTEDSAVRRWVGEAVRVGILVFAFTMALQQLDVASTFILLTFGLIFGAFCLALALAFGLGSKEIASELVKNQYRKTKDD